jgi:hypothetical protein
MTTVFGPLAEVTSKLAVLYGKPSSSGAMPSDSTASADAGLPAALFEVGFRL